jgi:hypothetical protein
MKNTFSNSLIKKTGNVGLLNVTNGTSIKYILTSALFKVERSKIEEKALTDMYNKKVLTWGRRSKMAKKMLTYFMDEP